MDSRLKMSTIVTCKQNDRIAGIGNKLQLVESRGLALEGRWLTYLPTKNAMMLLIDVRMTDSPVSLSKCAISSLPRYVSIISA